MFPRGYAYCVSGNRRVRRFFRVFCWLTCIGTRRSQYWQATIFELLACQERIDAQVSSSFIVASYFVSRLSRVDWFLRRARSGGKTNRLASRRWGDRMVRCEPLGSRRQGLGGDGSLLRPLAGESGRRRARARVGAEPALGRDGSSVRDRRIQDHGPIWAPVGESGHATHAGDRGQRRGSLWSERGGAMGMDRCLASRFPGGDGHAGRGAVAWVVASTRCIFLCTMVSNRWRSAYLREPRSSQSRRDPRSRSCTTARRSLMVHVPHGPGWLFRRFSVAGSTAR